jgi:PAS domain S-box-containing protein
MRAQVRGGAAERTGVTGDDVCASGAATRIGDAAPLRRLRDTGLLEGDGHPSLDRLTRTAAELSHAPIALVSLVDADRLVFTSQVGLAEPWASRGQAPFSHSFSRHVVAGDAAVVIPDSRADPRVRDSLAINDLGIAAYAGFPLHAPDGSVLGSFSVIDSVPREWAPAELALVRALANAAETEIALRMANQELLLTAQRMRTVLDTTQDAFVSISSDGLVTAWNIAAERLFGYTAAEALGRTVADLIIPVRLRGAHTAGVARIRDGAVSGVVGRRTQLDAVDRAGREFPIEMTMQVAYEHGGCTFNAFLHDISGRVNAQRQLEDERTFLAALLDSLDTGVAGCDAEGTVAVRNRALRQLYEQDGDAVAGTLGGTGRLYGTDARTPLTPGEDPLTRALAGERVQGQPLTVRAADGRRRRFVANAQPIITAEGRHLGAVAALHEVTDQHRAEVLREVQHAVSQALADAGSAEEAATGTIAAVAGALDWAYGEFWQTDAASDTIGRIGSWVRPGADLSAFTAHEPLTFARGEGLAGIAWDTDTELWIPEVADDPRTVARREPARLAGLHTAIALPVRSDGHTLGVLLFFTTSGDKPDNDLLTMLDGVCAHLGRHFERRRAEDLALTLAAARRDFDRAIAQINDFVWTFELLADNTPTAVYASPDGTGVFGGRLPRGTDLAAGIAALIHPDDEARMGALRATVIGGQPAEAEVRVLGLDGRTRWVWIRVVPRKENGRRFVDGIATDVTDRRELADRREKLLTDQRQQNRQLRELDRMKDDLVALVSHELRNPLSTIMAHTEMLLQDPELTGDRRDLTAVIERQGGHMNGLVDDLLEMAQLESGQIGIDPRPLPLARIVRESTDDRRSAADVKHLTLTIDVPRHLPVYADPVRLRQILDNLVSNAIKYTPAGGTIVIAGHREDSPARATAVLTVTDSGIGVPAEQYPHLFDRFFRASNAVSAGIKGTGLGLAITKAIVDASAGSIRAEPAGPQGGTTFTLTLPSTPPDG